MATVMKRPETDPRHHTENIKGMLDGLLSHVREDVLKVNEPRAQALFETTAEVLAGLKTAYEHYEAGAEAGFQSKSSAMAAESANPEGVMGES